MFEVLIFILIVMIIIGLSFGIFIFTVLDRLSKLRKGVMHMAIQLNKIVNSCDQNINSKKEPEVPYPIIKANTKNTIVNIEEIRR